MPSITGTSSQGRTVGSQASLTFAHTANGDDLYVSVCYRLAGTGTVTYGGTPLQLLSPLLSGSVFAIGWFYLAAAPAGTANIVITPTSNTAITAIARNVNGADKDGIFKNPTSATAISTAPSVVVTSAVGDLVMDVVASDAASQTFTVGAGQTLDVAQNSLTGTDPRVAASREAGAASVTMSWALSLSDQWLISALSIPADGTVTNVARVSQVAVEVLRDPPVIFARVSQVAAEVLREGPIITGYLSQVALEVLHSPVDEAVSGGGTGVGPWMGSGGMVWIE